MAASSQNTLGFDVKLNEIITGSFTQKHLDILQGLSKALREQDFRTCVERATLQSLLQVLSKLSAEIDGLAKEGSAAESAPVLLQLTAECFRSQRNACVHCVRNQTMLRDLGFIEESVQLLTVLSRLEPETTACPFEALRCGIQFLGNLAVGNQLCKDDIWKRSFPRLFLDLLEHRDEKTAAYTCMVLYTCLDQHKVNELVLKPELLEVARKVIRLCRTQPELDWAVFSVTQHFLKSSALVETLFAGSSHQERVTLLELMSAQLCEEGAAAGASGIPPGLALFLASCFLSRCRMVLSLASEAGPEDEEALTVMRLLNVLCEMTSDHKNFMSLQDHPELLRTAVDLLKEVHSLGKASRNVFSAAQNFPAAGPASHPAVSFKAHLVRLIGNLCHAHTANQNQVREMDGIPLILDNCNIDSNNPFISQWAIFAIRILLEHNPQNQEVVRALERRGVADDSALREMGFRLEERDGSLLLKPLSKDP